MHTTGKVGGFIASVPGCWSPLFMWAMLTALGLSKHATLRLETLAISSQLGYHCFLSLCITDHF